MSDLAELQRDEHGGRVEPPPDDAIHEAALECHRRGWSIIPIAAGTKLPPKGFKWKQYQTRLPTERDLWEWFADRGDLGLAVILGPASGGLVCRDFDDLKSYQRWKRAHGDLARMLPTVQTARGRHVYFRAPSPLLVFKDLRPGENGEYRGSGHYCLLPPSLHPDGPQYVWEIALPDGEIPLIEDVVAAGFFPAPDVTQKAQGSPKKSQVSCRGMRARDEGRRVPVSAQTAIEEAVTRILPSKPGTRRRTLLDLARKLKFLPELAGIPATEIDFLQPYLKRWWKLAKPRTSGKHPHFWRSWQDFVFAWEEARVPYGATMQAIFAQARATPAPQVAVEKYGAGSRRALLASLCRELQRANGGQSFYLSGRTAGPLLGVSDTQAWRWLKTLEADWIIETMTIYPRGKRLATEYRYLGD